MKIITLQTQNIKNIKAIEINANGKSVVLTGKNEVGKSTVLDSIMMALTGKMVERPIRDGEDRAEVSIDLGDYQVRRVWTEKGNRLEVTTRDGAKYSSPQALLNGMLGQLSFDPLAFKGMDAKRQRELLLELVGLDFDEHDVKRGEVYADRTHEGRTLKQLEGQIAGLSKDDGAPEVELSIVFALDKIRVMEESRKSYTDALAEKDRLSQKITDFDIESRSLYVACKEEVKAFEYRAKVVKNGCDARIRELEEEIANAKRRAQRDIADITADKEKLEDGADDKITKADTAKGEAQEMLKELVIPDETKQEDIDDAREKIGEIEQINAKVRVNAQYLEIDVKICNQAAKLYDLTAALEEMDNAKLSAVKSAKYPIEGLTVTDEAVLYEGIPFGDQSDGRKIQISTAIAMALNPNLRIVLIREGSLLDSEARQMIMDLAKDKDYQLWIESVSDEKEMGVHIEG